MKRIYGMASGVALLAASAWAQDNVQYKADQMKVELERVLATSKMMAAGGGVMGRHIKGAPYSAQEVNESSQTLGDGTRIRNESRANVYRDSEGRVRREVGDNVTIWDPVANVNYSINTKNMTAVKSSMVPAMFETFTRKVDAEKAMAGAMGIAAPGFRTADGSSGSVSVKDGVVTVTKDGKTQTFPVGPDGTWVSDDGKMRASIRHDGGTVSGGSISGATAGTRISTFDVREGNITITKDGQTTTTPIHGEVMAFPAEARLRMVAPDGIAVAGVAGVPGTRAAFIGGEPNANVKTESLPDQVIEGVKTRGTRISSTIEAGKIGNDRPLTNVNERWYSDELQVEVMSKRSDPRSGEQTYRLINISRAEPGQYLFQVPSGYTVTERR